jgi:hypothetical protein
MLTKLRGLHLKAISRERRVKDGALLPIIDFVEKPVNAGAARED